MKNNIICKILLDNLQNECKSTYQISKECGLNWNTVNTNLWKLASEQKVESFVNSSIRKTRIWRLKK